MPWQGGGKEGRVRLHCQEPGVAELLVHLEARQTNSRLFSTLSLTCTAFQETRHMLSGQPQLEYHGAGTRYAVPDLPYKCGLCHKKFRDMGGMMQHQVWKKALETSNPCNQLFRTLPTMLWTKDWPFVKRRKFKTNTMRERWCYRELKLPRMLLVPLKLSSWNCPLQIENKY